MSEVLLYRCSQFPTQRRAALERQKRTEPRSSRPSGRFLSSPSTCPCCPLVATPVKRAAQAARPQPEAVWLEAVRPCSEAGRLEAVEPRSEAFRLEAWQTLTDSIDPRHFFSCLITGSNPTCKCFKFCSDIASVGGGPRRPCLYYPPPPFPSQSGVPRISVSWRHQQRSPPPSEEVLGGSYQAARKLHGTVCLVLSTPPLLFLATNLFRLYSTCPPPLRGSAGGRGAETGLNPSFVG